MTIKPLKCRITTAPYFSLVPNPRPLAGKMGQWGFFGHLEIPTLTLTFYCNGGNLFSIVFTKKTNVAWDYDKYRTYKGFVIINMRNIYIFQNSKHWNFCKLKTRENWLRLSCQVPLSEAGGFFSNTGAACPSKVLWCHTNTHQNAYELRGEGTGAFTK